MRALVFVFTLTIVYAGHTNASWEKLDEFEQFITANAVDVEKFINFTLNVIKDATGPYSDFLEEIKQWPMPWEHTTAETNCEFEFPKRDKLEELLIINYKQLGGPLRSRLDYLKKRLVEISSSVTLLRSVAEFKNRSCSLSSNDCHEKTTSWVEENVSILKCKTVKDCQKKHVIAKRSNTACQSTNQFMCLNGQCINGDNVCGGANTCSDGSDETPQCQKYCFRGFHCTNLICIDKLLVCDGKDDCGDNSDEDECQPKPMYSTHNCTMDQGKFLCKNQHCIPLGEVCDGADGCSDGSDEGGLCGSGCPGGCDDVSGVCLTTPNGPVCLNKCPLNTVDTSSGCKPSPEVLPSTVEEVLEEVPRIVAKYISSLYQLKQTVLLRLYKANNDYSQCYGDNSFDKIIRLTNFNETHHNNNTYKYNSVKLSFP